MTVYYVVVNGRIYNEYYTRKEATAMAASLRKSYPKSIVTVERD